MVAARGPVGLDKRTPNLFRDRAAASKHRLDVRDFHHVLGVNKEEGWIEAEGMTPYDALVAASLPQGVMPAVVLQLKSITLGGAVAGVGIESSAFKYGLVHETVQEMDVLLSNAEVVLCTPENEHRDLFLGLPNSYGTLGYALRVRAKAVPVKAFVRTEYRRYQDSEHFFRDLGAACQEDTDFLDGVVFGGSEMVLCRGRFCEQAPYSSDYTFEHIYYRSLLNREEDYLRTEDYLWRWDTDWFWCSKNFGAQQPLVRRLLGRRRLNSRFYTQVMRWNSRWRVTQRLDRLTGMHRESVIQDVDIPLEHCAEFLAFLMKETGILPVWICPVRVYDSRRRYPLFPMQAGVTYVNFGFWDVVRTREPFAHGHHNRLIEGEVARLDSIKSLYSDIYFTEEEFWRSYDRHAYEQLKSRYDPVRLLPGLFEKCVLRH
ncbi:MAG: FAD-binding oxidoreductase [Betaproteobacteria bacterium]|nr:FAD-binding oxidoreductase [Betaproteobacteria bacterium]